MTHESDSDEDPYRSDPVFFWSGQRRPIPFADLPTNLKEKLSRAGTRGLRRSAAESRTFYEESVPSNARTRESFLANYLDGKDASHIRSHANGGDASAENIVWESRCTNRQRGRQDMTPGEFAQIRKSNAREDAVFAARNAVTSCAGSALAGATSSFILASLEERDALRKGWISEENQECIRERTVEGARAAAESSLIYSAVAPLVPSAAASLLGAAGVVSCVGSVARVALAADRWCASENVSRGIFSTTHSYPGYVSEDIIETGLMTKSTTRKVLGVTVSQTSEPTGLSIFTTCCFSVVGVVGTGVGVLFLCLPSDVPKADFIGMWLELFRFLGWSMQLSDGTQVDFTGIGLFGFELFGTELWTLPSAVEVSSDTTSSQSVGLQGIFDTCEKVVKTTEAKHETGWVLFNCHVDFWLFTTWKRWTDTVTDTTTTDVVSTLQKDDPGTPWGFLSSLFVQRYDTTTTISCQHQSVTGTEQGTQYWQDEPIVHHDHHWRLWLSPTGERCISQGLAASFFSLLHGLLQRQTFDLIIGRALWDAIYAVALSVALAEADAFIPCGRVILMVSVEFIRRCFARGTSMHFNDFCVELIQAAISSLVLSCYKDTGVRIAASIWSPCTRYVAQCIVRAVSEDPLRESSVRTLEKTPIAFAGPVVCGTAWWLWEDQASVLYPLCVVIANAVCSVFARGEETEDERWERQIQIDGGRWA